MGKIDVPCSPHGAHQSAAAMAKPEDGTGTVPLRGCLQNRRNVELSYGVERCLPGRRPAFPMAPPLQHPAAKTDRGKIISQRKTYPRIGKCTVREYHFSQCGIRNVRLHAMQREAHSICGYNGNGKSIHAEPFQRPIFISPVEVFRAFAVRVIPPPVRDLFFLFHPA